MRLELTPGVYSLHELFEMTPPPPPPHTHTQPIGLNPPPYFYQMNDQVVDVAHNNII